MNRTTLVILVTILTFCPRTNSAEPTAAGIEFFEKKIRPVLVKECYSCHSADAAKGKKLKAGLAVDTRAGLLKGGESGPAIVPNEPSESLLVKSLYGSNDMAEMPPKGKLPANVIADFEQWITMGAPDPRDGATSVVKRGMTIEEGRQFWSLRPPVKPAPPQVQNGTWPRTDFDRFLLTKLESQRLIPVPDADPRALIRRVTFDLTGLPPTSEEVEAFAANPSQEVFGKVVDRLLASPHFGEKWGRHWLDAARYADSNGKDRNVLFHHAWRYRDYVIRSFNADKPFDRFVKEQIAGDLLAKEERGTVKEEFQTATGFLALGPKAFEEQKREVFRMDMIDEQIDVIARTMLGLSVACARCHDHKFDPIPTKDYYALAGIFRSTETLYGYGPMGILAVIHSDLQPIGPDAEKLAATAREHVQAVMAKNLAFNNARSGRYRVVRNIADTKLKLNKPGSDNGALEKTLARMERDVKFWDAKIKTLELEWKALQANPPPQPGWAMAVREQPKLEDSRIHVRGETTNLGDTAPRGVLQVISIPGLPAISPNESGRLQLAEWIANRQNPLTARVFVNRTWQHLFGRGLVTTPDDFGVNGAKPTHPELLDFLAVQFMESGWSTKRLVRGMVMSRAYQLATETESRNLAADPDNVFRWRMTPRRLDAEYFRDAILTVSGQLAPKAPAPPPFGGMNPMRDIEHFPFSPLVNGEKPEDSRRSVYLPVVRGVLPEVFTLFDFADPGRPVAQRDESTVPAQSLFLMNHPWIIAQAKLTTKRLFAEPGTEERRIETLYRRALSRSPTTEETARVMQYLVEPESVIPDAKNPKGKLTESQYREERWVSFCQAMFASAEFRYLR